MSQLRSASDLCGTWSFTPEGGTAARIPVPAQWTHGACFGLPKAWEEVRAALYARPLRLPRHRLGRHLELRFGAVMLQAEVRLAGVVLGRHSGGFTPFVVTVPDSLWRQHGGTTLPLEVAVASGHAAYQGVALLHQVGYPDDSEEGPIAGGIWQGVTLVELPATRIGAWRHAWDHRSRRLTIEVDHVVAGPAAASLQVVLGRGRQAVRAELPVGGGSVRCPDLAEWTWRTPRLHPLRLELRAADGTVLDRLDTCLGLREVVVRGGDFLWNGVRVRPRGISLIRHRVAPYLWRRDYLEAYLGRLRRLGFNAVRLHAAIAPPLILDVCDELGLLVIDQSAIWSAGVEAYTLGGDAFIANTCREFDEWIARDRNHACILAWDVENEQVRIRPACVGWVDRLIAHVRTRSPLPVLASGAGVLTTADAIHLHCNQYPHRLQPVALRRPLIQGEWWGPDQAYRDTLRIPNRILPDPASPAVLASALADFYRTEITAQRARGAAGTFLFGIEVLLFRPLFAAGEALPGALAAGPDLPAVPRAELFQRDRNYHVVRRPLVNPGWRADRPAVALEPALAKGLATANAPAFIGIVEPHRDTRGGRRLRRTVQLVNDSGRDLAGTVTLRLRIGGRCVATARGRLAAGDGSNRAVQLSLALPVTATVQQARLEVAFSGPGIRLDARSEVWIWPAAVPRMRPALPVIAIGVGPGVQRALRRLGIRAGRSDDLPAVPALAVLGRIPANLTRAAVERFLDAGGRLILLRQEADPDAVPLPFRVRCADEERRSELAGIRHEPTQCTWLAEAVFPDPAHPAVAGLPGGGLRPFAAGDHRLADHAWLRPGATLPLRAGPNRVLVGGLDRAQAVVVECAGAAGLVLGCQLRLEENLGRDPQADALFGGLLAHAAAWGPPVGTVAAEPGPLATWLAERTGLAGDPAGSLRVATGLAAVRLLAAAGEPASATARWVRGGGRILVALPGGAAAAGVVAVPVAGDVFAAAVGEPLGWSSLAIDPLLRHPEAVLLLPGRGWRVDVAVVPQDPAGAYAGLAVGPPCAAALVSCRLGRGCIHVTGLPLQATSDPRIGLLWEQALAASSVAATRRAELADATIVVRRTPPIPFVGDLRRWTNEQPDVNIAPWSRAQPVAIDERHRILQGGAPEAVFRRGALFYLLHDDQHLYAAAQILAPDFDTHQVETQLYKKDSLEIRVGDTYLLASFAADGSLFVSSMGSQDDPGVARAVSGRVTRRDQPAHAPDRARLKLADGGLREALYELRIPWSWLGVTFSAGMRGVPVALAFNAAVSGPVKRLQCGFPADHSWRDRSSWSRLVLSPERR